jgi:hypothetical protein
MDLQLTHAPPPPPPPESSADFAADFRDEEEFLRQPFKVWNKILLFSFD